MPAVGKSLLVLERMAAGCSTAYFSQLALSWTGGYHICCDRAFWQSHFMSPVNFHTLNSCMKWHDTFSISFSFFCLSPLCFYLLFLGLVFFFKVGKTTILVMSPSIAKICKWKIQQTSVSDSHTPMFLCSSMLSFLEAHISMPSQERKII